MILFSQHQQELRRLPGADRHQCGGHAGRSRGRLRAVRLRQVDADPHRQPPRGDHSRVELLFDGHNIHAPMRSDGAQPAAQPDRLRIPELQPVSAPVGARERHAVADAGERRQARRRRKDKAHAASRSRRPCRQGRAYPGAAVGRPAAAGGDRPRARHGAAGDAVRRADQRARSRNGRRSAGRDARPGVRRHDHDVRHPRNGFRARSRGSGLVHGCRPDPREGRPRDLLQQPPASPRAAIPVRSARTDTNSPSQSTHQE